MDAGRSLAATPGKPFFFLLVFNNFAGRVQAISPTMQRLPNGNRLKCTHGSVVEFLLANRDSIIIQRWLSTEKQRILDRKGLASSRKKLPYKDRKPIQPVACVLSLPSQNAKR